MATIHICDRCGVRLPNNWVGLEIYEMNCDGRAKSRSDNLDLCTGCYEELVSDFDFIKRRTPKVDVKVVEQMSDIKRLGDIEDMERFLAEDCYCPGEIYDVTGFFCQVFSVDDECVLIERSSGMTAVVATSKHATKPQAIIFWHDDEDTPGRIIDAQRVDATDNNIGILRSIVNGEKPDGRKLNEFEPGSMAKSLEEIARISNLIIRDQVIEKEAVMNYYRIGVPDDMVADIIWLDEFEVEPERIVRCRDCKHSIRNGTICRHRRFAMRESDFDIVYVEPYGFCAWGDRRAE